MQELIQHLERLLPKHECVVVPGLGGFIKNRCSAHYESDKEQLYPTCSQLCFNARLNFNDGLLAQTYQESHAMSFEEANEHIRHLVANLLDKIDSGQRVVLGHIGLLYRNDEGSLTFLPGRSTLFDPMSYGLLPIVAEKPASWVRPFAPYVEKGNFGKWLAAVAACLLVMVIFPTRPDFDANHYPSHASIMTLTPQQHTHLMTVSESQTSSTEVVPSAPQPSKTLDTPTKTAQRRYHIVIASFPNRQEAEHYIQSKQLSQLFPNIGIAIGKERCRVYVESYEDKEEALFFLSEFRASHPKYAKSWVLAAN